MSDSEIVGIVAAVVCLGPIAGAMAVVFAQLVVMMWLDVRDLLLPRRRPWRVNAIFSLEPLTWRTIWEVRRV